MRRTVLYSRSPRARRQDAGPATAADRQPSGTPAPAPAPAGERGLRGRIAARWRRGPASLLAAALLAALLAVGLQAVLRPSAAPPTQDDIDAAVRHTLENQPPAPSPAAMAYEVIRPSVVLVRRLLFGDWRDDFLVLEPGQQLRMTYDQQVIGCT